MIIASMLITAAWGDYKTVDWFANHPIDRTNMLRWCADNIGLARSTPNCENALQAADKIRAELLLLYRPTQPQAPANPDYQKWCQSLGPANPCGN